MHLPLTHVSKASAVSVNADGSAPLLSKVAKKVAIRKTIRESLQEQDQIVQYICTQSEDLPFLDFIVTRPGSMIWDRPSRKKLAASKSVRLICGEK